MRGEYTTSLFESHSRENVWPYNCIYLLYVQSDSPRNVHTLFFSVTSSLKVWLFNFSVMIIVKTVMFKNSWDFFVLYTVYYYYILLKRWAYRVPRAGERTDDKRVYFLNECVDYFSEYVVTSKSDFRAVFELLSID